MYKNKIFRIRRRKTSFKIWFIVLSAVLYIFTLKGVSMTMTSNSCLSFDNLCRRTKVGQERSSIFSPEDIQLWSNIFNILQGSRELKEMFRGINGLTYNGIVYFNNYLVRNAVIFRVVLGDILSFDTYLEFHKLTKKQIDMTNEAVKAIESQAGQKIRDYLFKTLYGRFIYDHANLDSEFILWLKGKNNLDIEKLIELDRLRHRTHQYLDYFGEKLGKSREEVNSDIQSTLANKKEVKPQKSSVVPEVRIITDNKEWEIPEDKMWVYFLSEDSYNDFPIYGNAQRKRKDSAVLAERIARELALEYPEDIKLKIETRTSIAQLYHDKNAVYIDMINEYIGLVVPKNRLDLLKLVLQRFRNKAGFNFVSEEEKARLGLPKEIDLSGKRGIYGLGEQQLDSDIIGKKAFNLSQLINLGVAVPPGVVLRRGLDKENLGLNELNETIKKIETQTEESFGNKDNPLLVSVRSSPSVSMPGLLDTLLNVGINEEVVEGLALKYGERFAYEIYSRFLRSFGIKVFDIEDEDFGDFPSGLDGTGYKELAENYRSIIEKRGFVIPSDPFVQLKMAVATVYKSWNNPDAQLYRELYNIPQQLGTAVIIQKMKFSNLNEKSGSFVFFTRDPMTGEKKLVIEYASQSQGDDLVGGRIKPIPLEESGLDSKIIEKIEEYAQETEEEFRDMQDVEGVVEDGKVWILQTRGAKRSPEATVRIAVEMVNEGLITKEEALSKINLEQLKEDLLHFQIDPQIRINPIGQGEGVYSGAAYGAIVLSLDKLKELENQGIPAIWIKKEGYPQDYEGMTLTEGLVVCKEGILTHAAILGRALKKPTIVGVTDLIIDEQNKTVTIRDKIYQEGTVITIDGTTGSIYEGQLNLIKLQGLNPYFQILAQWYKDIYGKEI